MSENTFMPEEIFLNVQDLCSFILISASYVFQQGSVIHVLLLIQFSISLHIALVLFSSYYSRVQSKQKPYHTLVV